MCVLGYLTNEGLAVPLRHPIGRFDLVFRFKQGLESAWSALVWPELVC
jgi:hypothetical protein